MVVSSFPTRRLFISTLPLLLIFALIVLQARSATANEEAIIRVGAEKQSPTISSESALITHDLTTGVTPNDLANTLVGSGVTVSNVTYLGANTAAGLFNGGSGIIGFEDGIILSSGDMNDVVGPNQLNSTSTQQFTPGDPDLDLLSSFTTFDASVLEFDFVPNESQVFFQFVFASEEYNDFVGQTFNDAFGFFINGNNCALVENDPISVNTIHNGPDNQGPGSHPELFRNNDIQDGGGGIDTEADGLTVVLTCNASVVANTVNHMKLAIADATDRLFDSWVFLEAGSLTTEISITLGPNPGESCMGTPHTLVATVADVPPLENIPISFEILAGPNSGPLGSALTNSDGQAILSYSSAVAGVDVVQASFIGSDNQLKFSDPLDIVWDLCPPTPTPTPTVLPPATVPPLSQCELYPIALHANSLIGVNVGDTITDIYQGSQSGNFGWLSWAGDMSQGALVASLTPFGNSHLYINPNDAGDHIVSPGDWIRGRPGIANSSQVRQALDNLAAYNIIVPVWDMAQGNGSNAQYHVVDFAQVRVSDYHLPGQNRISAVFQGYTTCGVVVHTFKLDIKRSK